MSVQKLRFVDIAKRFSLSNNLLTINQIAALDAAYGAGSGFRIVKFGAKSEKTLKLDENNPQPLK